MSNGKTNGADNTKASKSDRNSNANNGNGNGNGNGNSNSNKLSSEALARYDKWAREST